MTGAPPAYRAWFRGSNRILDVFGIDWHLRSAEPKIMRVHVHHEGHPMTLSGGQLDGIELLPAIGERTDAEGRRVYKGDVYDLGMAIGPHVAAVRWVPEDTAFRLVSLAGTPYPLDRIKDARHLGNEYAEPALMERAKA